MKYQYYQGPQERCGLLLPFIAGALVGAPIAYLAGNNNTPEYSFPPQYQQPPYYVQPYPYQYQYQPQPQPFYPNNPLPM
ncbi:MAG: hypothetical protein R3Y05_01835 [bacterium]